MSDETDKNLQYVKNLYSWDSGGGIELDVIELRNGIAVVVSEECISINRSMEGFMEGEPPMTTHTIESD